MSGFDFSRFAQAGFGLTQDDVDIVAKALQVGYTHPASDATGAGTAAPYRVESLDSVLYNAIFTEEHAPLFRMISKKPARSVLEEYNVITSYGEERQQYFVPEISLPEEADTTVSRKAITRIKYMAVLGRVSFVATLVEAANGDPVAIETVSKTRLLVQQMERALFYGDSTMEPLEFDGLHKLITDDAPNNVLDVRGPLVLDVFFDGMAKVGARPNYGRPTDIFVGLEQFTDFSKGLLAAGRFDYVNLANPQMGQAGLAIESVITPKGTVRVGVVTGLAAIGRDKDLERLRNGLLLMQEAAALVPGLPDYLVESDLLNRLWTGSGVDTDGLLKTAEEVGEERQARAQAEAARISGTEMAKGAGKSLSNLPPEQTVEALATAQQLQ